MTKQEEAELEKILEAMIFKDAIGGEQGFNTISEDRSRVFEAITRTSGC